MARVVTAALGVGGAPLTAQSRGPQPTTPRAQGVSFAFTRYAAGGSLSAYLAQRIGPGMVLAGAVGNLHTHRRTAIIGGGTHLALSEGVGLTALLAGAGATDGSTARLYLLPRLTAGRLLVTATGAVYQPLDGRSRRQASINPLTATLHLTRGVRAGFAATVEGSEARPASAGAGPAVQLRLGGGTLSIEAILGALHSSTEVRVSWVHPKA